MRERFLYLIIVVLRCLRCFGCVPATPFLRCAAPVRACGELAHVPIKGVQPITKVIELDETSRMTPLYKANRQAIAVLRAFYENFNIEKIL